jgi:hypothetical protein
VVSILRASRRSDSDRRPGLEEMSFRKSIAPMQIVRGFFTDFLCMSSYACMTRGPRKSLVRGSKLFDEFEQASPRWAAPPRRRTAETNVRYELRKQEEGATISVHAVGWIYVRVPPELLCVPIAPQSIGCQLRQSARCCTGSPEIRVLAGDSCVRSGDGMLGLFL